MAGRGPAVAMYGSGHVIGYETQTDEIAEPSTSPSGDAHAIFVYNSTQDRYILWIYGNSGWRGVELL